MDDYADEYIPDSTSEVVEDAPERQDAVERTINGRDYETDARKQGWKPQDEFDGPADKWRPAKEFVERGNEDPRILRSRVDKLDKLYEGVKRQWQSDLAAKEKEFNVRTERLNKVAELAMQRQRESYEAQIAVAKRQAAAEGDVERFDQIEAHEIQVKKAWAADDAEISKQPEAAKHDPRTAAAAPAAETQDWITKNSTWFQKDRTLTDEAVAYESYLANAEPGLTLVERLEKTRAHVVGKFPSKFGRKAGMDETKGAQERNGRGGSPVEGSQRGANGSDSDGGFGKLPAEARAQFKAFVKEKLFTDDAAGRAKYAKYYDNPNADKVNG